MKIDLGATIRPVQAAELARTTEQPEAESEANAWTGIAHGRRPPEPTSTERAHR